MKAPTIAELSESQRQDAHKKYQLIEPYLNGSTKLNDLAKNKNIPLRTLNFWLKKYRQEGLHGLARKSRQDKGNTRKCDQNLREVIEGLYFKNPTMSSKNIYIMLEKYCSKNNSKLPSYRTLCRIIDNIPDDIALLNAKGSKIYKQAYDLLHRWSATYPNELWQADHVLIDIEIETRKGILQRPWLTVIMDDFSRGVCGYELSLLSPSSQKTALCLRHAIWRKQDQQWQIFGIPDNLYTDHGSDFTSHHIEQVCIDLKIQLTFSTVGCPRGRGKIERFFRTLNQKLVSSHEMLSTGKLTLEKLNVIIYEFILDYNQQIHSETGYSPIARWQNNGFIPRVADSLDMLDLLLFTEVKPRKVQRDGIKFEGLRYINIALAEYIGESVMIRYNPSDITAIRIYYKDKFLCQAICNDLATEQVSLKDIQKARNTRRNELKKTIKNRKSLVDAVIEASSQKQIEAIPSKDLSGNLSSPPKKIKVYKNE
ncbi:MULTISPECIES: Mu transposase C-terminal domain-containing protein [Cysteiniphilum]|uniref:Transposase n=1 Tax=Cysteiniphilum litorale TaxID=2056700 RepID=A0A8J3EAJ1_9GAMM|nr:MULTISPECIES: Mu transposase C-terminal domain-containing protein [Cysteiniphilum]GGG08822.1 transposase [Cysteiniphilum litorale]